MRSGAPEFGGTAQLVLCLHHSNDEVTPCFRDRDDRRWIGLGVQFTFIRQHRKQWPLVELELYNIFMVDRWDNFFVMVGSGAAALAGLIFVAISINPESIVRNSTHKNRAVNMLSGFSAIFMACALALLSGQSLIELGFEWAILWLVATWIFVRGYVVAIRSRMSSIGLNAPRLAGGTICYLAEVVGALFLIFGDSAGLYIAAIATIVLFAFLISGAWLLIIGIYEAPT